jgi:hypothetical protein
MKHNFKNYIKLSVLLLGVFAITFSCQKDDEVLIEIENRAEVILYNTSLKKAKHFNKIKSLIPELNYNSNITKGLNNRSASEFENEFIIDTSSIKYIEGPVSHSYTFNLLNNVSDSTLVHNLILAKHNDMDDYYALLMTYQLTLEELNSINQGNYPLEYINLPEIELIENFNPISIGIYAKGPCTTWTTITYEVPCSHEACQPAHPNGNGVCGHPDTYEISVMISQDCPSGPTTGDNGSTPDPETNGSGGGGIDWGGNPDPDTSDPNTDNLTKGPLTQINTPTRSLVREELEDVLDAEDLSFLYNYPKVESAFNYLLRTENSIQNHTFIDWAIDYLQNMYLIGDLLGQQDQLDLFNSIVDQYTSEEILNDLRFHEIAQEAIADDPELEFEDIDGILDNMEKKCQGIILIESMVKNNSPFMNIIKTTFLYPNDKDIALLDLAVGDGDPPMLNTTIARVNPDRGTNPVTNADAIAIEFNNDYLDQATNLSLVNTLYHELLHAYILHLYYEGELLIIYPQYTTLKTAIDNLIEDESNEILLESFANEMHNIYVDFIDLLAETLLEYVTDNDIEGVDLEYAKKLVWGGLNGSDVFTDNLTLSQRLEAQTLLAYEHLNITENAKGTKTCN